MDPKREILSGKYKIYSTHTFGNQMNDSSMLCSALSNVSGTAAAAAKLLQSRPTLCDLIDGSPLGSPVPGILQAKTLEQVAISFSNAWKWKVKVKSLSRVQLLATPWTAAHQAPQSIGFSIVLRKQHFLLKTSLSPNKMAIGLRLLVWFSNLGF